MVANKEYYETLELKEGATQEEIKRAYKKFALKYHPDKNPNGEAEFKKIGEAYAVLGDEEKRRVYDADGTTSLEKYGYDYGEEIEKGDKALKRYTDHISEIEKAWSKAFAFYSSSGKGEPLSSYHLIRMENSVPLPLFRLLLTQKPMKALPHSTRILRFCGHEGIWFCMVHPAVPWHQWIRLSLCEKALCICRGPACPIT